MCSVFFVLSYENVVGAWWFTICRTIANEHCSDMKVVAGFRPRCCGRAGERVPTAAMNVLRRIWNELSERLKLRRGRGDTSEDDEGLPHSLCNSPTTSDGLLLDKTAIKDLPTKSHSTCSDGSLLSMGSYEMDEDSMGPHSRHSSKLSLHERKSTPDSQLEFGPSSSTTPLNHSAAHHRVSVKPKRTHGAPKRRRGQQLSSALPATPEVNEEFSVRSISPEINRKETLTELYSMSTSRTVTETSIKCSSLPPGLTPPGPESNKLNRSKSNAGSKSQDHFSTLHEDQDKEEKFSILDRIFPRRSGRKKKHKEENVTQEETVTSEQTVVDSIEERKTNRQEFVSSTSSKSRIESSSSYSVSTKRESSRPIPAPRSGPASRQRVLPVDIPPSPEEIRKEPILILPKPSPERSQAGTSPLQAELENRFKQRQISLSTSPPPAQHVSTSPPQSPLFPTSSSSTVITTKSEQTHFTKSTSNTTNYTQIRFKGEDIRSKMKIPGLSSLQQRVLSLNDDDTDSFTSLNEVSGDSIRVPRIVTKSHSFKTIKNTPESTDVKSVTKHFIEKEQNHDNRVNITKAASLDSIKNLDGNIHNVHTSEIALELRKKPLNVEVKEAIAKTETKTENFGDMKLFQGSAITISGPSHTAIVNVTTNAEDFLTTNKSQTVENVTDTSHNVNVKEHLVSVTKIQVKRESTQVTQSTDVIPEFYSRHLNKVESRPTSNVILSMKSPRVFDEATERPKTLFEFETPLDVANKLSASRKFSKENLEIIEKNDKEDVSAASKVVNRFKKNDIQNASQKCSVISISPESPVTNIKSSFKTRSLSVDSLKSGDVNDSDKSSQDSLDRLDESSKETETPTEDVVVLRRKSSLVSKKADEEPELMKVFARRSLKLKDSDIEAIQDTILLDTKTRDSDKENQMDSPVDDRKKVKDFENELIPKRKPIVREPRKEEIIDTKTNVLVENKVTEVAKNNNKDTTPTSPPMLRRTLNNNIFLGQRAVSMTAQKTLSSSELIMKKQLTFTERRKTEQWITNAEDTQMKDKIIDGILPQTDFITEPKNFSQRKAEWEKRAQQAAQKKNTP